MKSMALVAGLTAFASGSAAAQWLGMPVWNNPKGGSGLTISGDYGKPNTNYGSGNAWGARASLGLGTLTVTAGLSTYKSDLVTDHITSFGGDAAIRVIGGSLLPIAVNLQGGVARTSTTSGTAETIVTGAVGLSVNVPTPGFNIEPYVSPGIRYRNFGALIPSTTKFGYSIGGNIGLGLIGLHLAYDSENVQGGGTDGVFGVGAHVGLHLPLGM